MRLKILVAVMGVLAVVLIVLETQYHYMYWYLTPRPAPVPTMFEHAIASSPAEFPADGLAEAPADVQAETPLAEVQSEHTISQP